MPFLILYTRIRCNSSSLTLLIHFDVNKTSHDQQSLLHGVMTVELCLGVMFTFWFCVLYSPAFDSHAFCLMSHVLFFHALLCLLSFKCLLCSSLCLPLSVVLFSQCIPLVISPVGPPHLFLVLSLVFVYLACVFPSLLVRSLYLSAPACSEFPSVFPFNPDLTHGLQVFHCEGFSSGIYGWVQPRSVCLVWMCRDGPSPEVKTVWAGCDAFRWALSVFMGEWWLLLPRLDPFHHLVPAALTMKS